MDPEYKAPEEVNLLGGHYLMVCKKNSGIGSTEHSQFPSIQDLFEIPLVLRRHL